MSSRLAVVEMRDPPPLIHPSGMPFELRSHHLRSLRNASVLLARAGLTSCEYSGSAKASVHVADHVDCDCRLAW